MVDLNGLYEVVELWVRSGTGVEVVYLRRRHVRCRHQGENLLGRTTDPAGGDLIIRELLADVAAVAVRTGGVRIENRDYSSAAACELAEISGAKGRCRNCDGGSARTRKFVEQLLPVEEKRAVPPVVHLRNVHGTAEHRATLVLVRDRNGALKERTGIQIAMGEEVEHLAMQFVSSGAKNEVRKPGSGTAILGVKRVRHDAELADAFHGGRTFANATGPSGYAAWKPVHVDLGVPDTRTVDPDILNALAGDAR